MLTINAPTVPYSASLMQRPYFAVYCTTLFKLVSIGIFFDEPEVYYNMTQDIRQGIEISQWIVSEQ